MSARRKPVDRRPTLDRDQYDRMVNRMRDAQHAANQAARTAASYRRAGDDEAATSWDDKARDANEDAARLRIIVTRHAPGPRRGPR